MRLRRRSSSSQSSLATIRGQRPIVTLTSDFGLSDHYVAAMKGVLIREFPLIRLIDVTHSVPRHDILCASITLERAIDGFVSGTTHLAVVDPGVGTDRRMIVARIRGQHVVCPDNGLITWAWRVHGETRGLPPAAMKDVPEVWEITWRPGKSSATFHGRDVMAPIAARVARGEELRDFARRIDDPVLLDLEPADVSAARGLVIHIDHFGNATTNIRQDALRDSPPLNVKVNRRTIGKLKRTYWDVPPGKPLALIGSSGLLEIAVRDGSARDDLNIRVGDDVVLR